MNEHSETLLPEPEKEKLLGAPHATPLLSAEELLATTPGHELAPLFGGNPPPAKQTQTFGVPRGIFPPQTLQKNRRPRISFLTELPKSLPTMPKMSFHISAKHVSVALALFFVASIVALYIWGGMLKQAGYRETSFTYPETIFLS